MLRLKNLANKYQKRTCRPLYANTQATPYAATLHVDPAGTNGFRTATGALRVPPKISGSAVTMAYVAANGNSIFPGSVLARVKGTEQVTVATGASAEVPFGLLANFVGGDYDEGFSGDSLQNSVGVWRGPDSVFEILAPAFDPAITITDGTSLGTTVTSAATGESMLYAGSDGRLTTSQASGAVAVARLIEKSSATRIVVELLV